MLKLIYQGSQLLSLLDRIETDFVILDWDNYLPFQSESFMFVLDDPADEAWLNQLPEGMPVYLAPAVRTKLARSDYPALLFQERLIKPQPYPARLHLTGDLEAALDFTGYLLSQLPFCVGFVAAGYRRERLEYWLSHHNEGFTGQLQAAANQVMILDFTSAKQATHQVVFWDGRAETLHRLNQKNPSRPRFIANIGRRVKQSDYARLGYIYQIPKTGLFRRRAWARLWQDILADQAGLFRPAKD